MRAKILLILCFLELFALPAYGNSSFFDQRYRGWLWFEERGDIKEDKDHLSLRAGSNFISPEAAKAEIEQLAAELEAKKFVMLARPTVENVKAYREKEEEMWDKAMKLGDAWEMANFMYPAQRDLITNPVNVQAVKMKRKLQAESMEEKIKEMAEKFDLVLFFQGDCKYCQAFAPVLRNFADKYGFKVEAVSMDGSKHEFFKTAHIPELIKKLGIEAAPTVVAISHDSKTAFELIRGYVSISELEEYSELAIKYLKEAGKW